VVDTSTALTSSTNPSAYGQSLTFTATVTAASGPNVPTGTVQFSVDGTDLGTPVGLDANGVAVSPAVSTLLAGGHAVIAAYSGDDTPGDFGFNPSGAVVTEQVHQATTQVTGSVATNPVAYGQADSVSVQVSAVPPGAGTPTGQVQFRLNGAALGAGVTLDANGDATSPTITGLLPGTYTVSYVASGDANFLGSNGSLTFTVSKIATATTLKVSPNPAAYGQLVTMTATVSHTTGPGSPSGTVAFYDGATKLATVTLSASTGGSSTASYLTTALAAATHPLTVVYSGDQTYATSTSAITLLVVAREATVLTANPATLSVGLLNLGGKAKATIGPLSATLKTASGLPLAGQGLIFEAGQSGGPVVCIGITNQKGVATCSTTAAGAAAVILSGGIDVFYLGNASYQPSSGANGLVAANVGIHLL
jgi:hypothetical protein